MGSALVAGQQLQPVSSDAVINTLSLWVHDVYRTYIDAKYITTSNTALVLGTVEDKESHTNLKLHIDS